MNDTCTRCHKARARRHFGRTHLCEPCYGKWTAERCRFEIAGPRVSFTQCTSRGVEVIRGKHYCKVHARKLRDMGLGGVTDDSA